MPVRVSCIVKISRKENDSWLASDQDELLLPLLCQNYGHLDSREWNSLALGIENKSAQLWLVAEILWHFKTHFAKIFYFLDKNCTFSIECDLTTNCKPIIFFKNVRHPWSCSNLKIFNPSKHFQKEFYAFAIILNALYGAFKKIIQWQKGVE